MSVHPGQSRTDKYYTETKISLSNFRFTSSSRHACFCGIKLRCPERMHNNMREFQTTILTALLCDSTGKLFVLLICHICVHLFPSIKDCASFQGRFPASIYKVYILLSTIQKHLEQQANSAPGNKDMNVRLRGEGHLHSTQGLMYQD